MNSAVPRRGRKGVLRGVQVKKCFHAYKNSQEEERAWRLLACKVAAEYEREASRRAALLLAV